MENRIKNEIPFNFPYKDLSGKDYTFAGVLSDFFEDKGDGSYYISKGWNSVTVNGNILDYVNIVLKHVKKDKALAEYEESDLFAILNRIRAEKGASIGPERESHFKWLIWRVYRTGFENKLYEDSIHWYDCENHLDKFGNDFSNADEKTVKKLQIQKSLSISQEITILKMFRDEDICKMDGVRLGIYLMFFLGLRNEECAGLIWDDIKSVIPNQLEKKFLFVHQSTQRGSGKLKVKMKTKNAPRMLPLLSFVVDKLEQRKTFLEKIYTDVCKMPIVNKKASFEKHVSSNDLTNYGKTFIETIFSQTSDYYSAIADWLNLIHSQGGLLDIKDPTTYLLRRNFATHLYNLGLSSSLCEYLMGHKIEDSAIKRSDYANEDNLETIYNYFCSHPFLSFFDKEKEEFESINTKGLGRHYFTVSVKEPGDTVTIELSGKVNDVELRVVPREVKYGTVDIRNIVNQQYKNGILEKSSNQLKLDKEYAYE